MAGSGGMRRAASAARRWSARGGAAPLGRRPTIAVLPILGITDEIIRREFVDAVSDGIADCLSRSRELAVISAATTQRFRDEPQSINSIAKQLSARYVVSGHMQRCDQNLTFTIRLTEANAERRLWSETIPARLDHVLDFRSRIVGLIANAILPTVLDVERELLAHKKPENLSAYELMLQAVPSIRSLKADGFDEASRLLARARAMDPTLAPAFAWGARLHSLRIGQGLAADRKAEAEAARALANEAIRLDPENSMALATAGHLSAYLFKDYATALEHSKAATKCSPSDPIAWSLSSPTLTYVGEPLQALGNAMRAIHLSPLDPALHQMYFAAGLACYGLEDYASAEHWLRKSLAENPLYTSSHKVLAASLVGQDRVEDARDVAGAIKRLEPEFGTAQALAVPFEDRVMHERYYRQLVTAGAIPPTPWIKPWYVDTLNPEPAETKRRRAWPFGT